MLGDAGGALLGGSSCNNLVPLGGHHGNRQALLDGSAASSVAVQAVGDGGYDLVGAFRGSGKNASGHDTVSVVSGWSSLTPSLLWLGRVLLLGLVPRHNDWVVPGPSKPALCGLCRSYALVRRLTAALVRGLVLLPGGTEFVTSGYRSMLSPWWCSVQRVPDVVYSVLAVHLMQVFFALSVGAFLRA